MQTVKKDLIIVLRNWGQVDGRGLLEVKFWEKKTKTEIHHAGSVESILGDEDRISYVIEQKEKKIGGFQVRA